MMDLKATLRAVTLEMRRELEGRYDAQGNWHSGDLERRLGELGVWRHRASLPASAITWRHPEDREARRVVDAFLQSRIDAGEEHADAVAEFVREAAYTWTNRLLALRCMEARSLIDEVILQKAAYGGHSLQHYRLARREPERASGEDEGLFATLFEEFRRRAADLPLLFNPRAPAVALRPSVAALKRCIALLSGTEAVRGQEPATDEVFTAPDAPGWAYQHWNTEEKDRVFETVRTRKGAKIEGADIIPATCIYTEPYMVRFLVQNSLGATWMAMHPASRLCDAWPYYVRGADRGPVAGKPVREIAFLDPACGSGHLLLEAFDLFYAMYLEEGAVSDPAEICASILERNLFGIDIDERAVQIAALALYMRAKEKAPDFTPRRVNLVATNIRLPAGDEPLERFLQHHPEDAPLRPALRVIFQSLAHAGELGSLLHVEEPVERELQALEALRESATGSPEQRALWPELAKPVQGTLPLDVEDYSGWKQRTLERLSAHFAGETEAPDLGAAFFGAAAGKGISLVDLLARRYDVVATNPPYMGSKNMGSILKRYAEQHFAPGKRDLYAAFILRCLGLARRQGRTAMVMPQSWIFIRSFAQLRATESVEGAAPLFRGVLRDTAIEALVQLGRHAFSEADPPSNVTLVVFRAGSPRDDHRICCFRLSAPMPAERQAALLRDAAAEKVSAVQFRPLQARFLSIPQTPLCYWLRDRFFELLAGRTLGDAADVCQGLATADDERFVRFVWEVPLTQWRSAVRTSRWVPFEKGGGYGKWFGHHFWAVDWERDGVRIKAFPASVVRNEQRYFREGWTYSYMARGGFGLRAFAASVFGHKSPAVFVKDKAPGRPVAPLANARIATAALRGLVQSVQLPEGVVACIPLPANAPEQVADLEAACVALKRWLVAREPTERTFDPETFETGKEGNTS